MVIIGLRPCSWQIICLLCSRTSTPRLPIRRMSYGGYYRIMFCNSRQKTYKKSSLIRTAKERLEQSVKPRRKTWWILKVSICWVLVASLTADKHHRHQVNDRILQKGPFASPPAATSENQVFAGTVHQLLAQSRPLLNQHSAHPLMTKHTYSRMRFWMQNETK